MTTPTNEAPAASAAPAAAPAAPQIDVNKLTEQATKAATEAAMKIADEQVQKKVGERLKEVGAALSGEAAPDPKKKALQMFVEDPLGTMNNLVTIAEKRVAEKLDSDKRIENIQNRVIGSAVQEYPQLKDPNKLALVDKLAEQYVAEGKSYEQALTLAKEDTVKEFGLKSVSELQKEGNYSVGLPGGGGFAPRGGSGFDDKKSSSDFLSGMKSRLQSVRSKAPLKRD